MRTSASGDIENEADAGRQGLRRPKFFNFADEEESARASLIATASSGGLIGTGAMAEF